MTDALAAQQHDLPAQLLASRERLNFDRALTFLAGRVRARNVLGAAEYLELKAAYPPGEYEERLKAAVAVCDLYREMFPRHYAASGAPLYSLAREQEFYLLCESHLFPLGGVAEWIARAPSFFLPCVPVASMQPHSWADGAFELSRIATSFQLAQVLSHRTGGDGGRGWEALRVMRGVPGPAPAPPLAAVGWQLFSYACAVEGTPLGHLPLAFHVTNYSAQTVYLDLPPGKPFGMEWSRATVAKLVAHRQQAERVLGMIADCDEWLDADPRVRIARVVELWNRASEVEAQSGYAGALAGEGQFMYVPEMPELHARMETQQA